MPQERRAAILKTKRDPLPVRYWRRLVCLFGLGELARNAQGIAKIRQYTSTGDITSNSELDSIASIRQYVDSLRPAANDGQHMDLVSACYDVL